MFRIINRRWNTCISVYNVDEEIQFEISLREVNPDWNVSSFLEFKKRLNNGTLNFYSPNDINTDDEIQDYCKKYENNLLTIAKEYFGENLNNPINYIHGQ